MRKIKYGLSALCVAALAMSASAVTGKVGELKMIGQSPFADGLGGNENGVYRIPAMAVSTGNVAIAVYDCRYWSSYDLPGAIDLAENYSADRGLTWEKPRVAVDVPNTDTKPVAVDVNIGDPCVVYMPKSDRFLVMGMTGGGLAGSHKDGKSVTDIMVATRGTGRDDKWEGMRLVRDEILAAMRAVDPKLNTDPDKIRGILEGPGHGIVQRKTVYDRDGNVLMKAGTVVIPMQYFPNNDFANSPRGFAVYSEDDGQTWKATRITTPIHPAQENCIVELDDGTWLMMCKGYNREFFRTRDFVHWTWENYIKPSCWVQGSCLKVGTGADGRGLYAACFSPANRADITVYFGRDVCERPRGIEWDQGSVNIYPQTTGGYSYNSLFMVDDHTLGILFEAFGHIYWRTLEIEQ